MKRRSTEDIKERTLVPMTTRMKTYQVPCNMMLLRMIVRRKIKANMTMENAQREGDEGIGGSLIAKTRSLQTVGVQEHMI